jgi:hypothetical protein
MKLPLEIGMPSVAPSLIEDYSEKRAVPMFSYFVRKLVKNK